MADGGTPVVEVCRQIGISEAAFHTRKKKHSELVVKELRKPQQLEDENERLRRIVLIWRWTSRSCRKPSKSAPGVQVFKETSLALSQPLLPRSSFIRDRAWEWSGRAQST